MQNFGGGPDGVPTVICEPYEHVPVAVAREIWNALRAVGSGAYGGGTHGVGFPAAEQTGQPAFISAGTSKIELTGGKWGSGQLIRTADGRWRWRAHIDFDSQAYQTRTHGDTNVAEVALKPIGAALWDSVIRPEP